MKLTVLLSTLLPVVMLSTMVYAEVIPDTSTGQEETAAILAMDFSEAIAACNFVTFDSDLEQESGFAQKMVGSMLELVSAQLSLDTLTDADKRRLGLWQIGNETTLLYGTLGSIEDCYREHGVMPQTGIDLYPELSASGGYDLLKSMSAAEVVSSFADAIDPITGHFYSSFSADKWEPGTMLVQITTDPVEIAERLPSLRVHADSFETDSELVRPSAVVDYRIYGEMPDSVILENYTVLGPQPDNEV